MIYIYLESADVMKFLSFANAFLCFALNYIRDLQND